VTQSPSFGLLDAASLTAAAQTALGHPEARAMSRAEPPRPGGELEERSEAAYRRFLAAGGVRRGVASLAPDDLAPEDRAYAAFAGCIGIAPPESVRRSPP
jgi:hypothetical protein